jgi:pimeloyl-ACP methyl ester carboxylesterase
MHSTEVRADVTEAVGVGEKLAVAATVHLPDDLTRLRAMLVAYPGSGYNRSYYDLRLGGDGSYSQALHHTRRGVGVVACDHLCAGDSSQPSDPLALSLEHIAAANAHAARAILSHLPDVLIVGAGQSMGGCFATLQQALFHSFDALALLGWSNIHTTFPSPDGTGRVQLEGVPRGTDLHTVPKRPYAFTPEQLRYCYHFDDVDESIVGPDIAVASTRAGVLTGRSSDPSVSSPTWRSLSSPPCSKSMITPGVVASEAAAIDVPVLTILGERDISADAAAEPGAYSSSPDASVVVVPSMAHMHNFATTRRLFWDTLVAWIDYISTSRSV